MRTPQISVKDHVRGIALPVVGFACFLVVMDFLLWGGAFSGFSSYTWNQIHTAYSIPSAFVLGIALIAGALAWRGQMSTRQGHSDQNRQVADDQVGTLASELTGKLFSRKALVPVAAGLALLGLASLGHLMWHASTSSALLALVSAVVGVGLALGILAWQRALCSIESGRLINVVLAACVAFSLVSLLLIVLPRVVAYVVVALLCCLSFVLLWRMGTGTVDSDADSPSAQPSPSLRPSSARASTSPSPISLRGAFAGWGATLSCLGSLGFVAGISRSTTLYAGISRITVAVESALCVLGIAIVLIVVWRVLGRRFSPERFYQVGFPVIATSMVVFAALPNDITAAFSSFAFFFFELSLMVAVVHSAQEAQTRGQDPVAVYALLSGVAYVLLGLGTTASLLIRTISGEGLSVYALAVVVCIYALSIPLVMQARRRNAPQAASQGEDGEGSAGDATVRVDGQQPAAGGAQAAVQVQPLDMLDIAARDAHGLAARFGLSPREEEILALTFVGKDSPTIAAELGLSDNTVRTHRKNIYRKLDVHSKQEALALLDRPVDHGNSGERRP